MSPAIRPPDRRDDVRLLVIEPGEGRFRDARFAELPGLLRKGDVLVVNDAATLPASLAARGPAGAPMELRLLGPTDRGTWRAISFGAGDWRTPTEHRPPPSPLLTGETIELEGLRAVVVGHSPISPRLVELSFELAGADLWASLYAAGRPVQYAYLEDDLALWSVQTVYASRPWAAEMPSAGRPLTWQMLLALRRRGVTLAAVTHAAGLSSTGDPAIDHALPLPELSEVPATTVAAITAARGRGGRVIAVGTSVVRALEGAAAAHEGVIAAGIREIDLVIGPGFRPRVVDGLLSGIHAPSESHYELLRAFVPEGALAAAIAHAERAGYRTHELGDVSIVLPGCPDVDVDPEAERAHDSS